MSKYWVTATGEYGAGTAVNIELSDMQANTLANLGEFHRLDYVACLIANVERYCDRCGETNHAKYVYVLDVDINVQHKICRECYDSDTLE